MQKGIKGIYVVAVNDAFVTQAWKEKLGAPNPVDAWLAARMARGVCTETQSDGSGSEYEEGGGEDEVRCTVLLQCIKVSAPDSTVCSPSSPFCPLHVQCSTVHASCFVHFGFAFPLPGHVACLILAPLHASCACTLERPTLSAHGCERGTSSADGLTAER